MKSAFAAILPRAAIGSLLFFCQVLILHPAWAAQSSGMTKDSGGGSTQLLPVMLGIPAECSFTSSYAFNNGAYPEDLVVVGSASCQGADDSLPYRWRNGAWSPLPLPDGNKTGGYAESVSDEPVDDPALVFYVYEEGAGWETWVKSAGQPLAKLSLLADMALIGKAIISAQGNHIVGQNSNRDLDLERAVRWTRNGAEWLPPEDIGPGSAFATTEDGSVVIGNTGGRDSYWGDGGPWVWTANAGGGGDITLLEPEAIAYDITHTGSMIVGARAKACSVPQCDFMPAPVYWVLKGGQWTMHDLQALDGVDSEAQDVAEINGQSVIAGSGFTSQNGGILRVVAWIPEADGSYGPPLRLEALGGNFDSWSWLTDINRNGLVLGFSEKEPFGAAPDVVWSLTGQLPFQINAGLNDTWRNADTFGQGFFITVFPNISQIFLAWFTYDTERPDGAVAAHLGDPGHRWLTAFGSYAGDTATLDIEMTQGGIFDAANPVPTQGLDGTITLEFSDCNAATVTYDIPSINRQGSIPITRIALDNIPLCQSLAAQVQTSR